MVRILLICFGPTLLGVAIGQFVAVKLGYPDSVWFWCTLLRLCGT